MTPTIPKEQIRKFTHSSVFRVALVTIGTVAIVLFVFEAGTEFGYRKAAFNYRLGDNYYYAFGPESPREQGMAVIGSSLSGAHGTTGRIVSLGLPTFIVADRDNTEKVVRLLPDTDLRKFREEIAPTDLAPGDFVVVIGNPNDDSEIEARLVRILPTLGSTSSQ